MIEAFQHVWRHFLDPMQEGRFAKILREGHRNQVRQVSVLGMAKEEYESHSCSSQQLRDTTLCAIAPNTIIHFIGAINPPLGGAA